VTSNLVKRVGQHKEELASGFPSNTPVQKLVWFEVHNESMLALIAKTTEEMDGRDMKISFHTRDNRLCETSTRHPPITCHSAKAGIHALP